nr:glycosyltransferase [uncultured Methanospirillum sp.]
MKIGIDLLPLSIDPKGRGITTYILHLINHLIIDHDAEYFLYNYKKGSVPNTIVNRKNVTCIPDNISGDLSSSLDHFVYTSFLALSHPIVNPGDLACSYSIIVYDIIPVALWEKYISHFSDKVKNDYFKRLYQIRYCQNIFVISSSVKRDLVELLEIDPSKITIIFAGLDPDINYFVDNEVDCLFNKIKISQNYFLSVPSMDTRKNVEGMIKAYARLPKRIQNDYQFVLANEITPDYERKITHLIHEEGIPPGKILFTDYLSRHDLFLLYQHASLFVFVPHYEGFGLPVIEAMAFGIPSIVSDNSCLPEIGGDAVLYVNSNNYQEIAETIGNLIDDKSMQNSLITKGKQQLGKFTWENTADLLFNGIISLNKLAIKLRIGIITPWNSGCAISEYSYHLSNSLNHDVTIFANIIGKDEKVRCDGIDVKRCWKIGLNSYEQLTRAISEHLIDIVHIQYHPALFSMEFLRKFITHLNKNKIKSVVTFHQNLQNATGGIEYIHSDIKEFEKINCIIVSNSSELSRLRSVGLNNSFFVPNGIIGKEKIKQDLGLSNKIVICALFTNLGLIGVNDEFIALLKSIVPLKRFFPEIILLVLPCTDKEFVSINLEEILYKYNLSYDLKFSVILINEFLNDEEIALSLFISDIVILPNHNSNTNYLTYLEIALKLNSPLILTKNHMLGDSAKNVKFCRPSCESFYEVIFYILFNHSYNEASKSLSLKNEVYDTWDDVARKYEKIYNNI